MQWTYPLGVVFKSTYWLLDVSIGRWLAVFSLILTLLPITSSFLMLRHDMVKLLLWTYEFWYITVINLACCVFVGMEFGDWRWCDAVMVTLGNQNTLMIDANFRSVSTTIVASTASAVMLVCFIVYYALGLVDATQTVDLIQYNGWSLLSSDIASNGLGTLLLILLRNAYRRFTHISGMDKSKNLVRSIQDQETTETSSHKEEEILLAEATPVINCSTRLQFVPVPIVFKSTSVLGCVGSFSVAGVTLSPIATRLAGWIATIGAVSTLAAITLSTSGTPHAILSQIALGLSSMYCIVSYLHHNRKMLRPLFASFDYLFLSIQLLMTQLSIGYLLRWNERCYLVLTLWLCGHWVVTLDAMTPDAKSKLGISRWLVMLIVAVELAGLLLLCSEFTVRMDPSFEDRVLLTALIHGHPIEIYAIPFLFSRLFTVFLWCLRLLWRLGNQHGLDGLLMMQGGIEYKDMEEWRRSRRLVAIGATAKTWRRTKNLKNGSHPQK